MKLKKTQIVLRLCVSAAMLSGNLTAFGQQFGPGSPASTRGAVAKSVAAVAQIKLQLPGTQMKFGLNPGLGSEAQNPSQAALGRGLPAGLRTRTALAVPGSAFPHYSGPTTAPRDLSPVAPSDAASGRSSLNLLDATVLGIHRAQSDSGAAAARGALQVGAAMSAAFDNSAARRAGHLAFADSKGGDSGDAIPSGKGSSADRDSSVESPKDIASLLLSRLSFKAVNHEERLSLGSAITRHPDALFQTLAVRYGISAEDFVSQRIVLAVQDARAISGPHPTRVLGTSYQVEIVRKLPKKSTVPDPGKPPIKGEAVIGYLIVEALRDGDILVVYPADKVTLEV
ncbi:MAG: hypothetical protein HY551_07355, partial [Elusimicrobia bacterium]|nr:hypothetical protein [Elusimicrobiota bacterium]